MLQDDLDRFTANLEWFADFFDGVRQFFGLVIQSLPSGFLPDDFQESSAQRVAVGGPSAPRTGQGWAWFLEPVGDRLRPGQR